jgi:hypothetical protein
MCGCKKNKAASHLNQTNQTNQTAPQKQPPLIGPIVVLKVAEPLSVPVPIVSVLPTVDTSVWGPPLWKALHIAAHHTKYKAQIQTWKALLDALRSALPCPDCSGHYKEWYRTHELRFSMFPSGFNNAVISWLKDLHNNVNMRRGLPTWDIPRLTVEYGGIRAEKLAEGRNALQSLRGVIGISAYDLLMSLLQ